jgi:hypothetical protein
VTEQHVVIEAFSIGPGIAMAIGLFALIYIAVELNRIRELLEDRDGDDL